MNINGFDLVIETNFDRLQQKEVMDGYIESIWPHMEIMIGDDCYPNHDNIFYYKNLLAYHSWNEKGRTKRNAKKMVHLIVSDGHCTIVHEGLNEEEVLKVFSEE